MFQIRSLHTQRENHRNAAVGFVALAAAAASIAAAPGITGILGAGLALLMLTIAVADAQKFIIPNVLTAAGFALGLAHAAVLAPNIALEAIAIAGVRGAALALAFLALRAGYARLRGRQGLGLGDVKLAGVAGAWLDWLMLPIVVEIAALSALTIYLLRHYALGRPVRATNRIPFGLFLAPAIWLCWLLEVTLLRP